jgi:hypothetical protein
MPAEAANSRSYQEFREYIASFARAREEEEHEGHRSRGRPRTHYRCMVSFERWVASERAMQMVAEWLDKTFPTTRVIAFLHRNTDHPHVHIWIDARKVDGQKVQLSDREYRKLDEYWNEIYSRDMGRQEREHIDKKRSANKPRPRVYEQDKGRTRRGDPSVGRPAMSGESPERSPLRRERNPEAILARAISEIDRLREVVARLVHRARAIVMDFGR